ncbi:MBL fold metallo-hydrolase [Deinococcus aerophilus]|uniref:Metallo-beta-lactamase domain-containing protein n=1 Tax=Deinococcus aerophilus TaxID=522488 RepID=A0ABQ2GYG2_9DEIO|nr:MBL fold metallo-hydrolase [Deinococcus aerophilus]GGM19862.1 hypothetical protein GCM10010841_29830 [Deinococcus aerophilus]
MSAPPADVEEVRPPGVDPRIRVFHAGEEVDTFVVLTRRFAVFIDTMSTPALMRQVIERVRPALQGRPVLVVNTHADWDHVYGNQLFAAGGELPGLIVGSFRTRQRLLDPAASGRLAAQQAEDRRFEEVRLVPPEVVFTEGLTLDGGDLTLELIPTPGHTPDHCSVWIPELRTLLAGDAAEFPFPSVQSGETLEQVRNSLRRLVALDPAVVLPCHGGTTDPALLEHNLTYFRVLREALQDSPLAARGAFLSDGDLPPPLTYEHILAGLGASPSRVPTLYREFHLDAVRATLDEWAQHTQGRALTPGRTAPD